MQLNEYLSLLPQSPTLEMNEKIRELKLKGFEIHHFGFGESPFPVPLNVQQALIDNVDKNAYYPTAGLPELRQNIANYFQDRLELETDMDQILIGPGSKELIFNSIMAIDGVLMLPKPSWVSYRQQAKLISKEVVDLETRWEDDLLLTGEVLEENLIELGMNWGKQKLLLLNYPNNPTGATYTESQIIKLAEVCEKYNIIVISDEIYGMLTFDGVHIPFAKYYKNTITTTGLSKDRSMGGYRIGVIRIPKKMEKLFSLLKSIGSETYSCVSSPMQHAAIEAYSRNEDMIQYIRRVRRLHEMIMTLSYDKLSLFTKIKIIKPKGAFYMFPSFKPYVNSFRKMGIHGSKDLAMWLLEKYKVATLSCKPFGVDDDQYQLRLAITDYDGKILLENFDQITVDNIEEFIPSVITGLNKIIEACNFLENHMYKITNNI
ncbi:MAG: aminotransferase class I/II-fold pyridoxal phosphate-dependent enzyme, partial [Candidatus Heimdallarchaeota archaeon]|nr:aminotransferase class I/II-fold pyridoxal phosphate-dependent enzyme [Candidatus Heimdallarchaeota archaeon]